MDFSFFLNLEDVYFFFLKKKRPFLGFYFLNNYLQIMCLFLKTELLPFNGEDASITGMKKLEGFCSTESRRKYMSNLNKS